MEANSEVHNLLVTCALAQRIRKARGWKESDPKYSETREILLKVWDGLRQKADANQDGQVRKNFPLTVELSI
jgi:hypothetical protein